ncbi:MAG: iron uptake porin [Leptolyngbyaceae bacterium]|nr:iron uptake porin [Leptolyngbyaceae bacterium]
MKMIKSLLVAPAVFGASIIASTAAIASEAQTSVSSLDQINQYSAEGYGNSAAQVTSVSQLSDVEPTDWAFQALQSLVERYGCIAGYPDGTYRGNRAMTRYEFAAGLNACLDRINELIAAGLADKVSREDLAVLQRLQEEFAAELATLRGRVDALEARVSELEANQFSTTTKLRGEVIFAQEAAIDQGDFDDQATFGYRVRLNFDTSFTGEDRLRTRFQARNLPDFDVDFIGRSFAGGSDDSFRLDDLVYTFPAFDVAEIIIGANSISCDDFVASTISPLDSSGGGSVSDFGFPRQYAIACDGDQGAGAVVQLFDNLSLDFGYSAANGTSPALEEGIFNGDYSIIGQLTFLSDFVDAAFTYVNGYAGEGFYNDAPEVANTYGGQINFKINDTIELGGGIAYVDIQGIGAADDYEAWSWQGTLAFNDLFAEGSQLGILAGVPDYSLDGEFIEGDDNGFLVEGYYAFPINDNILITPSIVYLADPLNNDDNEDAVIAHLRTTFSF